MKADSSRAGVPYAEEQGTLFESARFDTGEPVEEVMGDTDGAAIAARRPVRRPGSPTASWTTGRAPAWSSPPSAAAHGSGSQRLYSFRDILVLKVVKRLLDTGISLQQIRAAVHHLRDRGARDLAQVTLMSDGVSVYECTSPDEVVDLLRAGRASSVSRSAAVWQEVEGTLAELPAVRAEDGLLTVGADELSRRRARKTG